MVNFLYGYIAIVALVCVLAGLFIALAIFLLKEKDKLKDNPYILNFMSEHSEGYGLGIQRRVETSPTGRVKIFYSPKDVDLDKTPDIEEVNIIAEKEKIIDLPKGTLLPNKNIRFILPPHASDYPELLRKNPIGSALMLLTEVKNADLTHIDFLKEGNKRRDLMLREVGDGEISGDWMQFIKNLVKEDLHSMISKGKEEKKFSIGNPNLDNPHV